MRKWMKRLAVVLGVLLILYAVVGFVAANILFSLGLRADADRSGFVAMAHQSEQPAADSDYAETRAWYDAQNPEDVTLQSHDGLALYASCLPSDTPSHKWIIACHGYMGNWELMLAAAVRGRRWGYNTLLPDARACGQSEGEIYGMGYLDRLDLLRWIDWILQRDAEAEIVLYGMSMGGATVLMTSGEESLPPAVRAIVSDCAYASLTEEALYVIDKLVGIPGKPILPFASLVCQVRGGYRMEDCDITAAVERARVPILLIHGEADTFVPYTMMQELYAAIPGEKESLSIPGASHGQASFVDGATYWERMEAFIQKHMGAF